MKQRGQKVVQDGEGFKVIEVPFYKESLPKDRPSAGDLEMANRSGCFPMILRAFIRAKYGDVDYIPRRLLFRSWIRARFGGRKKVAE